VEQFIASYARPPQLIVLDCDDTEDPVHGAQEQARYDGYYGGYCFLPLHLYEGLSGRLITTICQATRFTGTQMLAVLKRVVKRRRQAWPDTLLIFRGDSHVAYPEVRQWIEAQAHLSYVTGLTSNAVLQPLARDVVEQAKRAYECDGGKITRFHSTRYQAGTWSRSRRVVIKVEVSAPGVNTRFVVTDMEQAAPRCSTNTLTVRGAKRKMRSRITNALCNRIARRVIALRPISSGCFCTLLPMCYSIPCAARCSRRRHGPVRRWKRSSSTCSNWEPACKN
jgi:Transposase DDE domain group 1